MKKSGYVALSIYGIYILYGLFWIGLGIYNNLFAPPEDFPLMHMEHYFGLAILLPGLIFLGIKALHLKNRLGILSFICAVADAFGVFIIWWLFVLESDTLPEMLPFIILSLFPAVACISNLLSMKRN